MGGVVAHLSQDFLNFLRQSCIQDKVTANFDVLCDGQVIIPAFWPLVIKYESVRQWKRSSPRLDIRVRFTGARYARRIHTPGHDQPPPAPCPPAPYPPAAYPPTPYPPTPYPPAQYPETIHSEPGPVSLPRPLVKRSQSTPLLRSRSKQDLLNESIGSLKTDPRKLEPALFSEVEKPRWGRGPHSRQRHRRPLAPPRPTSRTVPTYLPPSMAAPAIMAVYTRP